MEAGDRKLIKLWKGGNADAFNSITKRYEKYIYSICYHYTSSREDALDLLQEVYIKLYRSKDQFDDSRNILPWIKRITVNTCLNFLRGRKAGTVSLDNSVGDDGVPAENFIASTVDVEDEVSSKDTKHLVEDMIRHLPAEIKMAVILRHVDGMSYDEIAKTMNCPVGTVKTYLFRGRKILKEKLITAGIWEV